MNNLSKQFSSLDNTELQEVEGGFLPLAIIAEAITITAAAYGASYVAGQAYYKLTH